MLCVYKGAGSVSFWEFSGYDPYLVTYDQLVGDHNSIYVVVVSSKDSDAEQRRQFYFWLDYLRCHVTFLEPIGMHVVHDVACMHISTL